ncbi:MAG: hypothetical protein IPJ88_05440 [Myxococcales bacterium]|nr:MAG: hypothetical protein IPJ88_05440 [Myxococcales bacterium]
MTQIRFSLKSFTISAVLVSLTFASACAVSTGPAEDNVALPHVRMITPDEATLGTPVRVIGENFPEDSVGQLHLVFQGDFIGDDGSSQSVDEEVILNRQSATEASWGGLGPARNPFGHGTGVFEGTVSARVRLRGDGTPLNDPAPITTSLRVKPSIRVAQFLPRRFPNDDGTGICGDWVKRGFEQQSYILRVEAIGFEPVRFDYSVTAPQLEGNADYQPLQFQQLYRATYTPSAATVSFACGRCLAILVATLRFSTLLPQTRAGKASPRLSRLA